jgi:Sulfotransferase family
VRVRLDQRLRGRTTSTFDDQTLESRLVWIFGSPRSGSTWLLDLLVHPLLPTDESAIGAERRDAPDAGAPQAIPINEPYIPQHLTPPLFQARSTSDSLATVTLNSFRHASPSYFLCDRYADVWMPELRRLVLARLGAQARDIATEYGINDPLVIVKEPNGSMGADLVLSLFPSSRLIFLLRDGRDIVDSMVDAQAPGGWLEAPSGSPSDESPQARLDLVRHESHLWLARTQAVQRAYDAHPAGLRHIVRYEQARSDALGVLADLDRWLGLRRGKKERASAVRWNDFDSYPAEAKGRGMPLRAARPGLWRQNLTSAEQHTMAEIMGDKLAEVGYQA